MLLLLLAGCLAILKMETETVEPALRRVLDVVNPVEFTVRPLPGSDLDPEFSSRFETGIDCDFVFKDSIIVGNL